MESMNQPDFLSIMLLVVILCSLHCITCEQIYYDQNQNQNRYVLRTNQWPNYYRTGSGYFQRGQYSPYEESSYHLPNNRPIPGPDVPLMYHHSDRRCLKWLKTIKPFEEIRVETKVGEFVGRVAFLCDSPSLRFWERPDSRREHFQYDYMRNVSVFLGIPYAMPPVDRYRFKLPQAKDYSNIMNVDMFKPSCPQPEKFLGPENLIFEVDEDCLYLNIYTPNPTDSMLRPFPVMIFIHDGNFQSGSGNSFPGHMLALSQDVVVVTFNYRLGMLGFFATADIYSPGNYGLHDQRAAIDWVRNNIHRFGGDPNKITLFGPGAGAASAGLLAISPLTRKYIKRVIAIGGSPVSPWATINDPNMVRNLSIVIGKMFGCSTPFTRNLVECLRSRSASDFPLDDIVTDVGWLPFAPVPDASTAERVNSFLPDTPENLLRQGFRPNEPHFDAYLTGVTRDQGARMLLEDKRLKTIDHQVNRAFFRDRINDYLKIYNATRNAEAFKSAIEFMYSPWVDPSNESQIRDGLRDMYTDSWYFSGVDKMVKILLRKNIKTYMYVLNYSIEAFEAPEWMGVPHDTEYLLASGAPFIDEKFYPAKYKLKGVQWTEADRNMSQLFMEAFANFAKYGDPSPVALFNTIQWKPMSVDCLQYLSINTTNLTSIMHRDYRQKYAQFWNSYLPSLTNRDPPLWPPEFLPFEEELRIYRTSIWVVLAVIIILIFTTALCSCLYCHARGDRINDSSKEFRFPDVAILSNQYSQPSTRANSELSLNLKPRIEPKQPHRQERQQRQQKKRLMRDEKEDELIKRKAMIKELNGKREKDNFTRI